MRRWMIFLCLCFLLFGCASGGQKDEAAAGISDEQEEIAEETAGNFPDDLENQQSGKALLHIRMGGGIGVV